MCLRPYVQHIEGSGSVRTDSAVLRSHASCSLLPLNLAAFCIFQTTLSTTPDTSIFAAFLFVHCCITLLPLAFQKQGTSSLFPFHFALSLASTRSRAEAFMEPANSLDLGLLAPLDALDIHNDLNLDLFKDFSTLQSEDAAFMAQGVHHTCHGGVCYLLLPAKLEC